jgi:hypothetical protein
MCLLVHLRSGLLCGFDVAFTMQQIQERIYIVPTAFFLKLADEMPDPACKLLFVWSTGRCGSTLISQVCERACACVDHFPHIFLDTVKTSVEGRLTSAFLFQLLHTHPSVTASLSEPPQLLQIGKNKREIKSGEISFYASCA